MTHRPLWEKAQAHRCPDMTGQVWSRAFSRAHQPSPSHGHLPALHSPLIYPLGFAIMSLQSVVSKAVSMIPFRWGVTLLPPNPLKTFHHLKS